jgi:predicted transcriptional regulator
MVSARRSRGGLERDVLRVLDTSEQPMTPAQVRDALGGELAYTTVMTVLTRLHGKGQVTRQSSGRGGYAYATIGDPAEVTARRMQRLLATEDTDRAAVLIRFVDTLGPEDGRLLRSLLDLEKRP